MCQVALIIHCHKVRLNGNARQEARLLIASSLIMSLSYVSCIVNLSFMHFYLSTQPQQKTRALEYGIRLVRLTSVKAERSCSGLCGPWAFTSVESY